jgi:hypothetical protein
MYKPILVMIQVPGIIKEGDEGEDILGYKGLTEEDMGGIRGRNIDCQCWSR